LKYKTIKNYLNFNIGDIVNIERNHDGYFIKDNKISKKELKTHFEKIKIEGFKYAPYSHSKIEVWNSCPKKFFYNYVSDIELIKIPSPILEKGVLFHSILEHDMKNNLNNFHIDEKFKALDNENISQIVDKSLKFISKSKIYNKIKLLKGTRLVEQNFYLGKNLEPVKNLESSLIQGYIDLLIYDEKNNKCYIYDWKTGGKSKDSLIKFPKPKNQLELYSIWAFQIFPKINEIHTGFVYVEQEHIANYTFKREDLTSLKNKFLQNIDKIENDTKFKKNITRLCAWCDFRELCLNLDITKDPKLFTEQDILKAAQKNRIKKPNNDLLKKLKNKGEQ
jgi:CRISPR/Cas system-associated exonuclease Cas4 (RecB family)